MALVLVLAGLFFLEKVTRPELDPESFTQIQRALSQVPGSMRRAPDEVALENSPVMRPLRNRDRRDIRVDTGPGWSLELMGWTRIDGYLHDVDRLHGDVLRVLSPFDFAIGWDRAAQTEAIARIRVLHGIREATFHGLRVDEMQYVTNMHLIPGSPGILEAMSAARKGDRVALTGYAVTVRSPRMMRPWRSDMTYGDFNCEIVVVTGIRIEKRSRTVSAQL